MKDKDKTKEQLLTELDAMRKRIAELDKVEPGQTERTLQQYARRLETLREIDRAILMAQSPQAIAQAALGRIRKLLPCHGAGVMLFDLERREATLLAAHVNGETESSLERRVPLDGVEKALQLLRQGQPHKIKDVQAISQPPPLIQPLQTMGVRSFVSVPLVARDELIGSLNLGAETPGAFAEEQIKIAREVADQLAVALQQARLHKRIEHYAAELEAHIDRLRGRERHLTLLNDITRTAAGALDLQAMLQTLADRLGELLDADGCYITLWNQETQMAVPIAAYGPLRETYRSFRIEPGEATMTESVLRAGHALVAEDVSDTPYLSRRIAECFPARSMLGLPLVADGQKLGAALIAFNEPHHFTPDEIARGEQAAGQIALAVAKAHLLEQVQRHAEELERRVAERTAALRESKEKLRAQYKGIPIPTYTWQRVGEDFELVDYNDAAVAITRGGIADFVGKKISEMYPDASEIPNDVSRCFATQTAIKREMVYQYLSTGESKHLAIKYAFVPPDLILVHTEDITKRVQAEEKARQRNAELKRLVDLMAGREVRMAELKGVIRRLREQLAAAGLEPVADDPLAPWLDA